MPPVWTGSKLLMVLAIASTVRGWFSSSARQRSSSTLCTANSSGANIVLTTSSSANPRTFDSYKIGTAKAYRNDAAADNYVMWYHGRSKAMQEDEHNLPPLSTGRIGRATSQDGLTWMKDFVGSDSEDVKGVCLGLNQDSAVGFDVAHIGLGSVIIPEGKGGEYWMYYHGGSYTETRIADYIEKELPESMKNATIQGMTLRIGVAVSQDGVSWRRVAGDDQSGAVLVPFDNNNPKSVQDVESGVVVEEEFYCGWPEVAVVDKDSDRYVMFYSTMMKESKQKCIGYATSNDGLQWRKRGICIRPDVDGLDDGGCARCCVVRDATFDATSGTWKEGTTWSMFYEGVSREDGKHRILLAMSEEGGNSWKKIGLALDVGGQGDWDVGGVGAPHIVRLDDGTERMYYTGQGADGSTSFGVAKPSSEGGEGVKWKREVIPQQTS